MIWEEVSYYQYPLIKDNDRPFQSIVKIREVILLLADGPKRNTIFILVKYKETCLK